MDQDARRLERDVLLGDDGAVASLVRARRRAAGGRPMPRDGDRVHGPLLGALLRVTLAGRREIDVLRAAGVDERRVGRLIDAFRRLARGEQRPWSAVREWAPLLGIDLGDVAVAAEVTPFVQPPPRRPTPLPVYPPVSCASCGHRIWAVGAGQGVRCGAERSPVGRYNLVPSLSWSCDQFVPRTPAT